MTNRAVLLPMSGLVRYHVRTAAPQHGLERRGRQAFAVGFSDGDSVGAAVEPWRTYVLGAVPSIQCPSVPGLNEPGWDAT
jgi:hypothetical protein